MGTMPTSTSPCLDRGDDVRDVAERHRLARGEIGLREQRLLRERAVRPEEADPSHRAESVVGVLRAPLWSLRAPLDPRRGDRRAARRSREGASGSASCSTRATDRQRAGRAPRRRDRRGRSRELQRRRHHRARSGARPDRLPRARAVGRDLPAVLARRRGRHRVVALARRRLRRPHADHRAADELGALDGQVGRRCSQSCGTPARCACASAAPTMPASLSSCAGTISVRTVERAAGTSPTSCSRRRRR